MRRLPLAIAALTMGCSQAMAAGAPYGLSQQWAAAWSAGKIDRVMSLYAPDAEFMPGPSESWIGTARIRRNFVGVLAQYRARLQLRMARRYASGDLALESGTYEEATTPTKGGPANHARGNYLFVFRRLRNGQWKFLEQTWTEFAPAK